MFIRLARPTTKPERDEIKMDVDPAAHLKTEVDEAAASPKTEPTSRLFIGRRDKGALTGPYDTTGSV